VDNIARRVKELGQNEGPTKKLKAAKKDEAE
jgi:hypothetical protein